MKTKDQLIKEAYGDKYEVCKPDVDGWTRCYSIRDKRYWRKLGYDHIDIEDDTTNKWRPISLKGLEDNNGWFSIVEHGLPKVDNYYKICLSNENGDVTQNNVLWTKDEESSPAIWKFATHYKLVDNRMPMY